MSRRGLLLAWVLLLPVSGRAAPRALRTGRVTVYYYEDKQRALAERTAKILDEAHRQAVQRLGFGLPERATAVLCPTPAAFRRETRMAQSDLILGLAVPARRVIFLNCARAEAATPNSITVTLTHEACHLVFGEVKRRAHEKIPLWFEEGAAVWFSGVLPFIHRGRLAAAAGAGQLIPFSKLESQFPTSEAALRLAYEQSEDVLLFLIGQAGPDAVRRILARIDGGDSFPQAIEAVVGSRLDDLLDQWRRQVQRRHSWLRWLLRRVSLWSLMAVAVILLFLRYRVRRRRKLAEWRREEAAEDELFSDIFGPMEETDDRRHSEGN